MGMQREGLRKCGLERGVVLHQGGLSTGVSVYL